MSNNKNTFLSYPHFNAFEAPQPARKSTTGLNSDMTTKQARSWQVNLKWVRTEFNAML